MANDSANGTNDSGRHTKAEDLSPLIIPLQIGGKDIETNTTFDVINPSTGKVIWKQYAASKHDAIKAVEIAQEAFLAWSKTKPNARRDLLLKAADILLRRGEELGEYMVTETGAQMHMAMGVNVPTAASLLKDMAGRIATITASIPICEDENTSAIVYKEPYGVILGIAPWYAVDE